VAGGRDGFSARLKEKGVPTAVHYPSPLHHQPVYARLRDKYRLPVAERAAQEVLCLPLYPDMPEDIQGRVIQAVREVI
jgi:UDP-2-acetamido-2-deoxy-ribo-hexuluronate aminotransferase